MAWHGLAWLGLADWPQDDSAYTSMQPWGSQPLLNDVAPKSKCCVGCKAALFLSLHTLCPPPLPSNRAPTMYMHANTHPHLFAVVWLGEGGEPEAKEKKIEFVDEVPF